MNSISPSEYLEACGGIARDAGQLLMSYFRTDVATQHKSDQSPVSEADLAANALICKALKALTPQIPIIAEEDEAVGQSGHKIFWLVDPLDGTLSFLRGEEEFSVNIALIQNRRPVLGVLYAPPQDVLYYATAGKGAFRQAGGAPEKIHVRAAPAKVTVARSKSHPSPATAAYLKTLNIETIISMSSAIKFALVAEGTADIYPRFGRTMEWDTAAGHAIVNEAGGRVETADGKPLLYGKPNFENPPFIAYGQ